MALKDTAEGRWFLALLLEGEESVERLRKAMAGELPLEGLGEQLLASAACWTAKAPDGTAWDLRWFRDGRTLTATTGTPLRVGFRVKARSIQVARQQAVRIAHLIADGKTKED